MSWQTVLGFEIHVELATNTKMFCGCPASHFSVAPNTQTCPVCLGLPGALPVPNAKAIEWAIKLGLALGCEINLLSKFDRKNYFYPDLSKGYQISQYDLPFCVKGNLLNHQVTRVHLEEDTGKLQHVGDKTLIDFNRSGVPLVEIVTEPDFISADDGVDFLKEVQRIVRALGISSADMEKGSMRLEVNISVRPEGQKELPNYKIEVKNINSFKFVKKAIEFETARQIKLLESGVTPVQETRGFSETKNETVSQRSKENAHDYRYFPEPDIPPLQFTKEQIEIWRSELPELPATTRINLIALGLTPAQANILVDSPIRLAKYQELSNSGDSKSAAIAVVNCSEDKLADLTLQKATVITDPATITPLVQKIIADNPKVVADYKSGKTQAIFSLVGQLKRQKPSLDATAIKQIIESQLI